MEKKYLKVIVSARQILKNLRQLMARNMDVQERLDAIVKMVAEQLQTDVCSCYILRPGDILELWATKGLAPKSVHETFLRVGEGLIGEIALQRKSLVFEDVWNHASFVYKPETEEDAFHSLMGVPIIRGETLLGVLAVQTCERHSFPPEMVELLETVAMVVAEMIHSSQLKSPEKKLAVSGRRMIEGVCLIDGLAVGRAVLHQRLNTSAPILAKDSKTEEKKLKMALKSIEREVNRILTNPRLKGEQAAIFETYLMFTRDKGWIAKMINAIDTGLTAETAVQKVADEMMGRMAKISDPYIHERIHDFQDLTNRLIRHLSGKKLKLNFKKLPKNTILAAQNLGPAELLDYDISRIRGVLLEEGSQTMHVVIVARALNIPVISGIKNICQLLTPGDVVAMDAGRGVVYLTPSDDVLEEFSNRLTIHRRLQNKYVQMKDLPAQTLDGQVISMNVNAGLLNDFFSPKTVSFDGVGLYRTELPFMAADQLPDVKKQTDIYRRALLQVSGKPVVFRTLDIGSDKVLPYFHQSSEENPAMGWRSIRMTLDRRILLRGQLKAFIRAAAGRELKLMFPMIASVEEFIQARQTFERELAREKAAGRPVPSSVQIGTMLEVPSLLFQMDELMAHVDFISIGTNDLAQFLFAADRGNPLIWNRYDPLSPAFLKTLKYIVQTCERYQKKCSVCGEMAGRPLEAIVLCALGYRVLSMNPSALGAVKAAIRTTDCEKLARYLDRVLNRTVSSLRPLLLSWARDHGVFL